MDLNNFLGKISKLTENWFEKFFNTNFADSYNSKPSSELRSNLYKSMIYSLMAGGKRLRPALTILGYNYVTEMPLDEQHPALPFAAGVEMIHTYSLIHDDLPGMDDDDMRRGKPTNHIVYGVATAILAGDGLLTKAFEIFTDIRFFANVPADRQLKAAFTMARAVGSDSMVGGQYVDMAAQGESSLPVDAELKTDLKEIDILGYIHRNKTAEFMAGCLAAGAILAGANELTIDKLYNYGLKIGAAFQMADDILDVTASSEELGKPAGSDNELDKLTYPKLLGLDKTQKLANKITKEAIELLDEENNTSTILKELARFMVSRRN